MCPQWPPRAPLRRWLRVLLVGPLFARPMAAQRLAVERFTQAHGLAGDQVNDLHQDRAGFLWI